MERYWEVKFSNTKLLKLYETGSSGKYRLDKTVIKNFFQVVAILEAAKDIHDLWRQPSLHFERLQGRDNYYSVRLTLKWRLEMSIAWSDEKMTVGIISIEEISSHYGG